MVSADPEKGHGNRNINRAVQNNWPLKDFNKKLDYKLEYKGKLFVSVDERYSTRECNACGHRMKLDPSVRVYRCPEGGMVFGRDDNSATNLLNRITAGMFRKKMDCRACPVRTVFHRTMGG